MSHLKLLFHARFYFDGENNLLSFWLRLKVFCVCVCAKIVNYWQSQKAYGSDAFAKLFKFIILCVCARAARWVTVKYANTHFSFSTVKYKSF